MTGFRRLAWALPRGRPRVAAWMDADLAPFARRCTFPYLHGVYLAVNAIPDACLLVDAPACAFQKAEQIFGTHDLMSDLLDADSRHRVVHTSLHVSQRPRPRRARLIQTREAGGGPEADKLAVHGDRLHVAGGQSVRLADRLRGPVRSETKCPGG